MFVIRRCHSLIRQSNYHSRLCQCLDQNKATFSSSRLHRQNLKWSYKQGDSTVPMMGVTIGQLMQEQVEKNPDKEIVVSCHQNIRKTFSELLQDCDNLAAGLLSMGIQKGDRVGIWSPNCYEWLVVQYATARAGIILVNINPAYQAAELGYAMRKVGVRALFLAESFKTQDYYQTLISVCPELSTAAPGDLNSNKLPDLKLTVVISDKKYPGTLKYSDVMDASDNKHLTKIQNIQDKLQFDEPINIQFTSGTTGAPKGATLTHHNIVNNSLFTGRIMDYHIKDTSIAMPVPLYHCFGMVLGSLSMFVHGARLVLPSAAFEADKCLKAVQQEKCTSQYGTPTMFIDMLNLPDFKDYDLTSLYTGVMAGSPCPIEVMKQVVTDMHMSHMTICYGTTENSPVTFQTSMHDKLERRVSTIGQPHPNVEAKIVDDENNVVPVNSPGELCIRGYGVMLNYWNDSEKTAEVIKQDRWYYTGDIATMNEDGYAQIVGRIKDMVIRGGENIYPLEVEQFLYKHPKIEDVQVVGVPDARLGEQLCAWIRLRSGQTATDEEIKEFCKGQIAHFKIPYYIQFVEDYPMTVTGKIQKYKIREQAAKDLGL